MSRGLLAVACALVLTGGCKDKDKDAKAPPKEPPAKDAAVAAGGGTSRAPAPPTDPAKVTLDPEPTPPDKLPPPETGFVRLESLDADIKATKATTEDAQARVEAGDCFPRIVVDIVPKDADSYLAQLGASRKVIKKEATDAGWILEYTSEGSPDSALVIAGKVGEARYLCDTILDGQTEAKRTCATEVCSSLRAVKGGTLEKALPAGTPVIETFSGGGIDGGSRGGVNLWEDGTLHFHGPKCKQWRGRTGKVDAAAMTALVDAFRKGQVDKIPEEPDLGGADCVGVGMRVTLDGTTHAAGHSQCNDEIDPTLEALFGWITATVGPNPCVY